VVLRNWKKILGSRFLKEIQPRCRIKSIGCKKRNEILVAKAGLVSKMLSMIVIARIPLDIHISRIPF